MTGINVQEANAMATEINHEKDLPYVSSGAVARANMLDRVRRAQPASQPYPSIPVFPIQQDGRNKHERLEDALAKMGGGTLSLDALGGLRGLTHWLSERFGQEASIASAVPEIEGNMVLGKTIPPTQFADLDVGIVRARFGICETGSVWLSEAEYVVNAIGYLAQHLVVLLDPDCLEDGVQHAYLREDFTMAKYCVLVTGPSATADIEGVMIRGAQGVRSLTVIWAASPER